MSARTANGVWPRASEGPRATSARRGFVAILSGNVAAQLIVLATLPIVSRLYSPEDVARYAILLGVGTVLASVASLRLDFAIPLPEREGDSRALAWIAAAVALAFCLIGLPIAIILSSLTGGFGDFQLTAVDWVAIFVFVLLLAQFSTLSQLAIRLRIYGSLGRIPVLQSASTAVLQIGLGLLGYMNGLFVGAAGGRGVGITGLMRACRITPGSFPSRTHGRSLMRRFWRFPVIFAPASMIEVVGTQAAVLLLPGLYGLAAAGYFAMALRLVGTPMQLVSQSAGQVFLGEFSRTTTKAASLRVFYRWSAILSGIAVGMGALAWFLPPVLLTPILGSEWSTAVSMAQWLGVASAAALVGSPVQHVWTVRQWAWAQAGWNALRLAMVVGALLGASRGGLTAEVAVQCLCVGLVVAYAISWIGTLAAAVMGSPDSRTTRDAETAQIGATGSNPAEGATRAG